ncbi:hypothetical protein HYZ78_00920 [Candidatus Microgenomates bacterium]|nr:hypothetical protein [Candidatus Microgenomates bacterium]
MGHVSKRKLPEETKELIDKSLLWILSRLKGKESELIIESLLTPTERVMLAKRIGILFLLNEGKEENTIAETLKVTQGTVSRIKIQHKLVSSQSSNFLFRKLKNWQEFTTFKTAMQDLALKALKTFSKGMAGKI